MITSALKTGAHIILLTPTADITQSSEYCEKDKAALVEHAEQIRQLAVEYNIGLADSLAAFEQYAQLEKLSDLLSWANHPNRTGHELVVKQLLRWFPICNEAEMLHSD